METKTAPQLNKYTFGKTYTVRLRRHQGDMFNGLWEFCLLKEDPKAKVERMVSDADGLSFCMDNFMGVLEDDGY